MTREQFWAIAIVVFVVFVLTGWRTAADVTYEEKVKQQLKWMDRDTFRLSDRISDLEQRVKALESRP